MVRRRENPRLVSRVEDAGDLNLILIKITRKEKWVVFPAGVEFETDRHLLYTGWKFVNWDQFWAKQSNRDLVQKLATASVFTI